MVSRGGVAARAGVICGSLFVLTALPLPGAVNERTHVLLGPEILISRNEPYGHVETTIAAAASSQHLVAAAITFRGDYANLNAAYSSADGGNTWRRSFDGGMFGVAGDPEVAYANGDVALFENNGSLSPSALGHGLGVPSRSPYHYGAILLRQNKGGGWRYNTMLGINDRPMLFVDRWSSSAKGTIYASGMGTRNVPHCNATPKPQSFDYHCIQYYIRVYRSRDGAQFSGPYHVVLAKPTLGVNSVNSPQIMSDGRIIYPYTQWSNLALTARVQDYYSVEVNPRTMAASAPRLLARQRSGPGTGYVRLIALPLVLAGDHSTGPYKDRLYAAWSDWTGTGLRLAFSTSTDFGRSWSAATWVARDNCVQCLQYMPTIAVAPNGDVGLMWLYNDNPRARTTFDVYFAASTDGGRTFLPPRRVTSVSSDAANAGNLQPIPYFGSNHNDGNVGPSIATGFSRFPAGGDYLSMSADRNSVFHMAWADARSGPFQLYTATAWAGSPPDAHASIPAQDVTKLVDLQIDPMAYDQATHTYMVPIRIRNASHKTLAGPFSIATSPDFTRVVPGVTVVNADNGVHGNGARMSYDQTMRDVNSLPPAHVTGARVWRLRAPSAEEVLYNVPFRVYARVVR
jgi:hypothetical protein